MATLQFLRRRAQAGQNWLGVFFVGDTDEMPRVGNTQAKTDADEFDQPPYAVIKSMVGGGVSLPWGLALTALIGLSLLFTRIILGVDGTLANAHHVIGALVLTVVSIAAAEVARSVRYLNIPLGVSLIVVSFIFNADMITTIISMILGVGLIGLSLQRGSIRERYGNWDRFII